jgi:hypothetical protein
VTGEHIPQPLIDPDEYGRLVRRTSDEDLQTGLRANGELIVEQIFRAMPGQLRPGPAASARLVAEWRIGGVGDGGQLRWQVAVEEGLCTVTREGQRAPDLTFSIGGLDFLKLVTGNAKGPLLFLLGRLKIRGDLLKAARFQGYFRSPRPEAKAE